MKVKYPKTSHLKYSEKISEDDIIIGLDNVFKNKNVVVSVKMDGENTTIYNNDSHARSLNSDKDSEDRRWIELFRILKVSGNISDTYRLCGENLFYKHTIKYEGLESFFYMFSIWDGVTCLSWDDVEMWSNKLKIQTVPIIYRGVYDTELIKHKFNLYNKEIKSEGFVVRVADSFQYKDFDTSVSKFVSKDFVIPSKHWKYSAKEMNGIIYKKYWDIK